MRRFLLLILFSSAVLFIPVLVKRATGGFRLGKLGLDFPVNPEWDVHFDPKLEALLNQPFYYLGRGAQCYAFESKDQQIVIKLFRFRNPRSKIKILNLLQAASIAYNKMKEETGLLYIHLNPTHLDLPKVSLKDAVGRSYRISLDEYRFAIQKKAKLFEEALNEALQDPILMKKRIDQFAILLKTRVGKGIYNSDPTLGRNFGFLETRAIELDFGNYKPLLPHSQEIELERFRRKFHLWLEKNAPEWVDYLRSSFENTESVQKI